MSSLGNGSDEHDRDRDDTASPNQPPNKIRRTRVARACENCRARRIKCAPPYPCQSCRDAGLTNCYVRDKARPMRRPEHEATTSIIGSSYPARSQGLRWIDRQVESIYSEITGSEVNLELNDKDTHPACDLTSRLPALPLPLSDMAGEAIRVFTGFVLPIFSYMPAASVITLFDRYATNPKDLLPEETALILACLAVGFLTLQSFTPGSAHARHVPEDERMDVPFFRQAVNTLSKSGGTNYISFHAIATMWFYSTVSCRSDTTRYMVSWLIAQGNEIVSRRQNGQPSATFTPYDRPELLFVQVLCSHYWSTVSTGHAPLMQAHEFDKIVQNSRPHVDETGQVGPLVGRRLLLDFVIMNTQIAIELNGSTAKSLTIEWLMTMEQRQQNWADQWVRAGRSTGYTPGDEFMSLMWDWGNLTMRASTLTDTRLDLSTLAILSRSASQVIETYYRQLHYAGLWLNLRQISSTAHAILLCYHRQAIGKIEAEQSLSMAAWMLGLMEPRWTDQASEARRKIILVGSALGLNAERPIDNIETNAIPTAESMKKEGAEPHPGLEMLFELYDATQPCPDWHKDPWVLGATPLPPQ